jgi:peptidoglycan/xylan/chitin deacetylase (PgdA/CDA1 family)
MFARHMKRLAESADCLDGDGVARFFKWGIDDRAAAAAKTSRVNITLDDGWRGCVEHGEPILEQFGCKAYVFVTTNLIGRPGFLTRAERQRLPSDRFEIGSHAVTHGFLNEQSSAEIHRELADSRAELQGLLGRTVDAVSIPNGAVNDQVRRIAVDVGYRLLYTSDLHLNTRQTGPLRIGRAPARRTTTPDQVVEFSQGILGRQNWRNSLLRIPKRLLGPRRYRSFRRTLLGERGDQLEMHELAIKSADDSPRRDGAAD